MQKAEIISYEAFKEIAPCNGSLRSYVCLTFCMLVFTQSYKSAILLK